MFSYWEQQSFLHYDHIVIGSGIVGLSTAIELKDRFPQKRVLVLERSLFPLVPARAMQVLPVWAALLNCSTT